MMTREGEHLFALPPIFLITLLRDKTMPSVPSPAAVDINNLKSIDQLVQQLIELETSNLTDEQLRLRSLALFPQTHTDKVTVMGVERYIRPLPLKYARQMSVELHDVEAQIEAAFKAKEAVQVDAKMADALKRGVGVMCSFYKETFNDIQADMETEEEMTAFDYQLLCNTQQRVQGTNDFLLVGLRLVIKMMQLQETLSVRQQMGCQISSNTPPLLDAGTALSMS